MYLGRSTGQHLFNLFTLLTGLARLDHDMLHHRKHFPPVLFSIKWRTPSTMNRALSYNLMIRVSGWLSVKCYYTERKMLLYTSRAPRCKPRFPAPGTLLPDSAMIAYNTEVTLFISVSLSLCLVSTLKRLYLRASVHWRCWRPSKGLVDDSSGWATLTNGLLLGRSEMLRSLRHYLRVQNQEHHTIGRLPVWPSGKALGW